MVSYSLGHSRTIQPVTSMPHMHTPLVHTCRPCLNGIRIELDGQLIQTRCMYLMSTCNVSKEAAGSAIPSWSVFCGPDSIVNCTDLPRQLWMFDCCCPGKWCYVCCCMVPRGTCAAGVLQSIACASSGLLQVDCRLSCTICMKRIAFVQEEQENCALEDTLQFLDAQMKQWSGCSIRKKCLPFRAPHPRLQMHQDNAAIRSLLSK